MILWVAPQPIVEEPSLPSPLVPAELALPLMRCAVTPRLPFPPTPL